MFTLIYCGINAQVLTTPPDRDDEFRTIFDGENLKIGAFGGPMMTFSTINGEFSHMMGGGGGIIIGGFYFGGYGMGLTNNINYPKVDPNDPDEHIEFGHGGFMTGFAIKGNSAIHPVINTLIGWGNVSIENDNLSLSGVFNTKEDGVFVFEPSLQMEMNFTKFFRVAVGCGYRLVSSLDLENLTNDDFSGISASLTLKFGWF